MGDFSHSSNPFCPSCKSTNVRVMTCQDSECEQNFCEICHPNCRIDEDDLRHHRFDAGIGLGPICKKCMEGIEGRIQAEKTRVSTTDDPILKLRQKRIGEVVEIYRRRWAFIWVPITIYWMIAFQSFVPSGFSGTITTGICGIMVAFVLRIIGQVVIFLLCSSMSESQLGIKLH
jgi:hypothetical protein